MIRSILRENFRRHIKCELPLEKTCKDRLVPLKNRVPVSAKLGENFISSVLMKKTWGCSTAMRTRPLPQSFSHKTHLPPTIPSVSWHDAMQTYHQTWFFLRWMWVWGLCFARPPEGQSLIRITRLNGLILMQSLKQIVGLEYTRMYCSLTLSHLATWVLCSFCILSFWSFKTRFLCNNSPGPSSVDQVVLFVILQGTHFLLSLPGNSFSHTQFDLSRSLYFLFSCQNSLWSSKLMWC